jgi:hypothetical protein
MWSFYSQLTAFFSFLALVTAVWFASAGEDSQNFLSNAESCKSSHRKQFERVKRPVWFSTSPQDSFAAPKIEPLNSTAGDQWAFDGTSASGKAGFLIGFYRDPSYSFLGPGNFRLSLDVVWDDGTTWSLVDYLQNSTITTCAQSTKGTWSKPDHKYSFEISADNQNVVVSFDTPSVQGSFSIVSTAPARYPDGSVFPSETATTFNAPSLHWVEPIPAGIVDIDLNIEGRPFRWTGLGGCEHWWSTHSWLSIMKGWTALRASIGPYTLSYWAPTSRFTNKLYPSPFLTKDGEKIFATQNSVISTTNDYFTYKTFSNGTAGKAGPDGYVIRLVSPNQGKEWQFEFTNQNMEFEFEIGRGSGSGSAYVGTARGGEVERKEYQGIFFHEHVDIGNLVVPKLYVILAMWFYWVKSFFL